MGLPIIDISFKQLAKSAVARSQRGIVALILKDTTKASLTVFDEGDIPASLTEANQALIKDVLKGSPNKIELFVLGADNEISEALTYFEGVEFNLMCMPQAEEADKTAIKAFIKKMNDVVKYKCDAILANEEADSEAIINYTAKDIVVGGETVTTANHTARMAGIVEGTQLHQSITFATLSDVDSIENLTKEEADNRIDAGELILVREMGKVRVARGVNSLTTLTDTKGNVFQKIKLRKTLNLIHNDLRRVIVEKYIGKVPNNYDNKCILITEIKNYLDELATEQLIEKVNTVGIDLIAQKKWLKDNTNLDVNNMSEQEIKEANTQSNVFIAISLKVVDAMEDIMIGISI
ncbi:MAG: phage tail sheath subtilisin-like domain-containing protein [Peptostreptococcaceae bacterium]|nr:phage tail sheath subtilisin-like domain-containing protein [Peptostreptococcaceae bacterium]